MDRDRDMDLANFYLNPDLSFGISDVESAPSQDDRSTQPYEEEYLVWVNPGLTDDYYLALNENPVALDDDYLHENPLDDDYLHENPLDDDYLHENPLDDDYLHENPLDDGYLHENPLDDGYLHDNPLDDQLLTREPTG